MRTAVKIVSLFIAGAATAAANGQTGPQNVPTQTGQNASRIGQTQNNNAEEAKAEQPPTTGPCANLKGKKYEKCAKEVNARAAEQAPIVEAYNAAQAKMQAGDFDGAIADFQRGVAAAPPNHPNLFELHSALATAYRNRAVKVFNAAVGPGVSVLPPATLTAVSNDLRISLEEAQKATTAAGTDQAKLDRVGVKMRESAELWAAADRSGVANANRPTLDFERAQFEKWAPTASPQDLTKYTPGMAFALLGKDKPAALTMADTMLGKQPADTDTIIAYVQIVAEAKLPPTDPRRVKAKAAVASELAKPSLTPVQKNKLQNAQQKLT